MNNDLENRTGVPAPLTSRRTFIREAAATGVASIFSPGLVPISAQESGMQAAQFVLPNATKDVTRFKVHVPQSALDVATSGQNTPWTITRPRAAGKRIPRLPISCHLSPGAAV